MWVIKPHVLIQETCPGPCFTAEWECMASHMVWTDAAVTNTGCIPAVLGSAGSMECYSKHDHLPRCVTATAAATLQRIECVLSIPDQNVSVYQIFAFKCSRCLRIKPCARREEKWSRGFCSPGCV